MLHRSIYRCLQRKILSNVKKTIVKEYYPGAYYNKMENGDRLDIIYPPGNSKQVLIKLYYDGAKCSCKQLNQSEKIENMDYCGGNQMGYCGGNQMGYCGGNQMEYIGSYNRLFEEGYYDIFKNGKVYYVREIELLDGI